MYFCLSLTFVLFCIFLMPVMQFLISSSKKKNEHKPVGSETKIEHKFENERITGQSFEGREGKVMSCECYWGCRKASLHAPIRLQIHHGEVHHTYTTWEARTKSGRDFSRKSRLDESNLSTYIFELCAGTDELSWTRAEVTLQTISNNKRMMTGTGIIGKTCEQISWKLSLDSLMPSINLKSQ